MPQRIQTFSADLNKPRSISAFLLGLIDFSLLNVSFFGMNYWKRGTFVLTLEYEKLLLVIYGLWFVAAMGHGDVVNL